MIVAHIVDVAVHNDNSKIPEIQHWECFALSDIYNTIVSRMSTYDNEEWEHVGGYCNNEFTSNTSLAVDFTNKDTGASLRVEVKLEVNMKIRQNASPALEGIVVTVDNFITDKPEYMARIPLDTFATTTPANGVWNSVQNVLNRILVLL